MEFLDNKLMRSKKLYRIGAFIQTVHLHAGVCQCCQIYDDINH